mgnify:CR=1 FL=1
MGEVRKRLPLQCPACDSPLRVGRLFCEQCDTEVCGNFELPLLARLTEKEQLFIVDFLVEWQLERYGEEYGSELSYC